MKQWLIIIILLLLLFTGGYFFLFRMVAPKAARAFIPVKWQNIPLGEKKAIVHEYLGEPDTVIAGKEHWEQKLSSIKKYMLDVEYRGDTIALSYQVTYQAEVLGFKQSTDVYSDTLK